ncbi:hypothetical protein NL676_018451 [Syzygium grande]|nr:hypothetical protein NL676_018451 [Syzygium grande]
MMRRSDLMAKEGWWRMAQEGWRLQAGATIRRKRATVTTGDGGGWSSEGKHSRSLGGPQQQSDHVAHLGWS